MKKIILAVAVAAVASMAVIASAVPAMAGNGATIKDMKNTHNHSPLPRTRATTSTGTATARCRTSRRPPTAGVTTNSGVYNQVLKGIVANDTGATVTYSANSGGPIPAGQECWSFTTGTTSDDWSMTIDADGHYTLNCHFAKA